MYNINRQFPNKIQILTFKAQLNLLVLLSQYRLLRSFSIIFISWLIMVSPLTVKILIDNYIFCNFLLKILLFMNQFLGLLYKLP